MKRIKKLASLVLALTLALTMALPALAADNKPYTITVKQNEADKAEHTYNAYQIFEGDLAKDDLEMVLSNINWGKGIDGPALLAALKSEEIAKEFSGAFDNCETAAQVAEDLGGDAFWDSHITYTSLTDTFARIASEYLTEVAGTATGTGDVAIGVTGAGYYLVKDVTENLPADSAYTRFLLEVVDNATVNVKSEVPTGDKEIYIEGPNGDITTGDANNASIGSHVSYVITSKVPNHVGYNYYYFIMNDTLSEGLTFDGVESVAVTVGGTTLEQGKDYYVYTENVEPCTFRLAFTDIMQYTVGADIVLTYSATINDKAIVGTTGNQNTWNLQYSNNPGDTFDGERPDGENTPGLPADEENEALGETPEEKTLTYVTELDITKYANSVAENHLLAGAEFTLTGTSKQVVLNTVDYYEASEKGTYYLLLDGTYTDEAPTGTEYVEIGVGTKETTTGYIKNEDGNFVVPTDKTQYEGKTIYKLVKGTATDYADVNTKYEKKTATETTYVDADVSIELTTGADGKISFKDLGAGKYTLTETVTPDGFNTIDPIEFEIVFTGPDRGVVTGEETCIWDIVSDDFEVSEGGNDQSAGGIFSANIINKSGSLLPSTGGIGTTIFYVVGGILVIGAGILLVTKKRMSAR